MIKVQKQYPLPRIQSGAMTGNGSTGLLLWGGRNILNVTIGSSRVWDHRGGMEWRSDMSLTALEAALAANDVERIHGMFAENISKEIRRPSIIPIGRIVIILPKNCELRRYEQLLEEGRTDVVYADGTTEKRISFVADMSCLHDFACDGLPDGATIRLLTSYELCQPSPRLNDICEFQTLKARGFTEPVAFEDTEQCGFIQPMPADDSFAIICRRVAGGFSCDLLRGIYDIGMLKVHRTMSYTQMRDTAVSWWQEYWQGMPAIATGDAELDEIYWHGLFKYGIMTNPAGYPPGLQGPWIEDDHTPPWSGDYHLNINMQMYMEPGFKAGKFIHLRPMFDMILSWKTLLRQNAKNFLDINDGYVLPHAVDDRGVCQGGFWTGTVDYACGAWLAMMMFSYCEYSGDIGYLREQVYDFMVGIMRVYETVLEKRPDGSYFLPIGVSPEYNSSDLDAYGSNASFQLAAVHRHIRNLIRASEMLGVQPKSLWLEIGRRLPQASVSNGEIALWDGLLLEESHRHHSHLGGIYPFAIYDPDSSEWAPIIKKSIDRWIMLGMGQWTGWCLPWAAIIHIRCGNPEAAIHLLRSWKLFFTNEGGGSLHDSLYRGFSIFAQCNRGEIMQIDGAMGAVTAIQELFLFERDGLITVFAGIPRRWHCASFKEMAASGGFRVSGYWQDGMVTVTITAVRTGIARIRVADGKIREFTLTAGDSSTFKTTLESDDMSKTTIEE